MYIKNPASLCDKAREAVIPLITARCSWWQRFAISHYLPYDNTKKTVFDKCYISFFM